MTTQNAKRKTHLTQQCAKEQNLVSDPQNDKKKIPYDGLSYTWGNPQITVPITIVTESDERFLFVTTNLFSFLQQYGPKIGSEFCG
jgi:hypothetical protein